ncbi:MAG: amino acid adenylation domain-containing protein, partial [Pirellulaceae bacterium]
MAPRTPLETQLAKIWTDVLAVDRVGVEDNFFALGGHSLLAVQVISRVRDALDVEVPLRELFEQPTVARLATAIEQARDHATPSSDLPLVGVPRSEHLPLSFAQERQWFLNQLEPESPFYHIASAVRLTGHLDLEVLRQCLVEIVARHETLRTTFLSRDGTPELRIAEQVAVELPVIDLTTGPQEEEAQEERELELKRRLIEEVRRPFDLASGPLFRVCLLRLSETEHVCSLVVHHIVSDAWSHGVMVRELTALYEAFSAGRPSPLLPLRIQYADYASWQRKWLSGERLQQQLNYWEQQLDQAPEVLDLPTDRPRPRVQRFRGARYRLEIDRDLTNALQQLGRQHQATLFMTLLASFQLLLSRYSGQEDICVGSPIAGRNRAELERLIGFFVNTLVLRGDVSGNPAFEEFLARVRKTTLGAFEHQDLPFEQLVQHLQPTRDLSREALFQVMFVLQNVPMSELKLPQVAFTPVATEPPAAKFDLTLTMWETKEGLTGNLDYNTDLFDRSTIERMMGHFHLLMRSIVENPGRRVMDVPLLPERERRQLLVEWNDTARDYDSRDCLHELVERQVERTPDAIAVVFEGQQLTYEELNQRANQLAHYLSHFDVGPDVPVGVCLERSPELVISLLAILKAGGAYAPLDPDYPSERLGFMVTDSQPAVVLTTRELASRLPASEIPLVHLEEAAKEIAEESKENPLLQNGLDDIAYVIYTSGSTGTPKGVRNTHRGICNRLLWMQEAYSLAPDDRVLQKTPFSFDVSVWEFFWPLLSGARLVVARPGGHKDAEYLARLILEQQITTLHFVPSMLQVFLEEEKAGECQGLKRVICSGEALPYDLQQRFFSRLDVELHNLYGPTEAAIDVTYWQCRENDQGVVPIGKPIANTQCYILDRQQNPVPVGIPGELHLGGVGLARDYLNRPDLTTEKFIPDPFASPSDARLYKTGDLCRYLPDGNILFLGRLDGQVKIRGNRIELGEIQVTLLKHPDLHEAVVTAVDDGLGSKELVAYLVAEDAAPEVSDLCEFLQRTLPDYMIPSVFIPLEAIPLNANGKVDYKALPRPIRQRDERQQYVPPQTPDEQQLADIWSEVLHLERIGIHDNFFALGGHSLLAVQVMSRVSQRLHVSLPLREIFQTPTVAELATRIEAYRKTDGPSTRSPIVPVSRDGELPLSLSQEALWFLDRLEPERPTYSVFPAFRI